MSITATTLSAAVTASDLTMRVASATGFVKGYAININGEYLGQTADADGTTIAIGKRGQEGTYNQAHASGSVVLVGLPSDFPTPPPGTATVTPYAPTWNIASYNAAGTIAVPTAKQNVFIKLKAGSGAAMTIGDPGYGVEGVELIIQAEDAQAYTLTNTTGFNGGGSGADVGTFGGAVGDNIHLKAVSATWKTIATRNVTLA